jgi:hypothetical protein
MHLKLPACERHPNLQVNSYEKHSRHDGHDHAQERCVLAARADPEVRRRDYELALRHYLKALSGGAFDLLVFAENSDSDLGTLRAIVSEARLEEKVEFLSIYGLDSPAGYSRGYGEFLLLDRVMESELMRRQSADSIVWKVTGCYRIANIEQLIRDRPKRFDFYCNCRDYPIRLTDQYLQAWRVGAYSMHLKGLHECFKESETGKYGEQVMRDLLDSGRFSSLEIVQRFTHVPVVEGVRGWDNQEYSAGLKNRGKLLLRQVANRALPSLWI